MTESCTPKEDRIAALLLETLNREVPACMTAAGIASMYGTLATTAVDLHLQVVAVHGKPAANAALRLYLQMVQALVDESETHAGPLQ